MSEKKGSAPPPELDLEVDYDHLDVGRIMEAIKSKASREDRPEEGRKAAPPSEPEPLAKRSRIKRFLLKIMTPFAPLIKLFILPVYEEQRQILLSLHRTNQRLDALVARVDEEEQRQREYIKLLHHLAHNIVVEMSKLKIELDLLKTKTRVVERDLETLTRRERILEREIHR